MLPQDLAILPNKSPVEENREETGEEYKIKLLQTLKMTYEKLRTLKEKEQAKYKSYYDKTHIDMKI